MSTAFSPDAPPDVGPITLPISPPSSQQYLKMIDDAILDSETRIELIGGQLIPKAPAGPEHGGSIINFPRLFAAAKIEEYWIADVSRETITVFRDPQGVAYLSETTYQDEQVIAP